MTLKEAKNVIYANVIYACETAGLSPSTIAIVKDACDTVIAFADKADTQQTDSTGSPIGDYRDGVGAWQTDCDRFVVTDDEGTKAYLCMGCPNTDCPWG